MAQPWVADGGDGLEVWSVAANTLIKQTQTADKWWSSSLEVGRGIKTSPKKKRLLRNVKESLGFGRIFWKDLVNGKWM
jgi:hypothetical protein